MNRQIYLDYNASTPLAPEVAEAMRPFLSVAYGNPSSLHWAGSPARDAVEKARSQVAALLCCDATEVIFTSGGTEANNYAIKGAFFSAKDRGAPFHIITSCIEHPAVLEPCRFLQALGAEITLLRVDRFGVVDPDDVRRAIRPHTRLITQGQRAFCGLLVKWEGLRWAGFSPTILGLASAPKFRWRCSCGSQQESAVRT